MSPYEHPPLTVLWRGSLASCNYACGYCPFAKTQDDKAALQEDRAALERYVDWVKRRRGPVSTLITPWGEGLIRSYYRQAMIELSRVPNVPTIAIQTNLSCSIDWLEHADLASLALWTTYHPGETPYDAFLEKIHRLEAMGARYSVGVVGLREHFNAIEALRRALPDGAYLWVNAYKDEAAYYSAAEARRLSAVDPYFPLNLRDYATKGRPCATGESVISVKADGAATRCHFAPRPIGNIYAPDFDSALKPRLCSENKCQCHIGYSHLKELDLQNLFGGGFLERRAAAPQVSDAIARLFAFDQVS